MALVLALLWVTGAQAVPRDDEPVSLSGSAFPELEGLPIGSMALFAYDGNSASYVPVPFQIDQRVIQLFNGGAPNQFSHDIYDVFRNDDSRLDDLDELAFLFRDAADQAPTATPWPPSADPRGYEIRIVDTRTSSPEPDRFVYLFTGPELARSPVSYVSWGGHAYDDVTTDRMVVEYDDRWLLTGWRVTACGTGADMLDRLKTRAGTAPEQGETEEIWNETSITLGRGPQGDEVGLVGPIRSIRYVRGAASGVNTIHHDVISSRQWRRTIDLRTHPVNAVWQYLDWLPGPGRMMYTPTQPGGVAVDGSPDGPMFPALDPWHLVRGPEGGLAFLYDIPPSPFYGLLDAYIRDDASYNDAPLVPPSYGDEDDSAYGNHGFRMSNLAGSDTDNIVLRFKAWGLCSDEGDANLGAEYQELEDFPLQTTATVERSTSETVDLSVTMTVDNPTPQTGSFVEFVVTVSNAAGFDDATGVGVLDVLPSGYLYSTSNATAGSYFPGSGLWQVGALPAGSSEQLVLRAFVRGTGDHTNQAEVSSAFQSDVDDVYADGSGNDHDAVTTNPVPVLDLRLDKLVSDTGPEVGAEVIFNLRVSSVANFSAATGLQVKDLLPSGYTYGGDDSINTGTSYDPATGIWDIGALAAGDSISLNLRAAVNASGDYTNVAEIFAADQPDTDDVYNDGQGEDWDSVTTTPGAVRTVVAGRVGADVVLDWAPLSNATSYRVYRSDTASAPKSSWTLVGEVTVPTFLDPGAATLPEALYYSVVAVTASGEGPH